MVDAGQDLGWTLTFIMGVIIFGLIIYMGWSDFGEPDVCEMTMTDCIALESYFGKDDLSFRMDCIPVNKSFEPLVTGQMHGENE